MLFMAAFAVCLWFTQIEAELAAPALLVALCSLNFVLPLRLWRYMTYGALIGIAGVLVLMMIYVKLDLGIAVASNYQESQAIDAAVGAWKPYIFTIGSFVGGSVGLLLHHIKYSPSILSTTADR